MSSSTSSSERRWPTALLAAIAIAVALEWVVGATAPRFMESQPLVYETKMNALDGALAGDIVIFGDSTAVASIFPAALDDAFSGAHRVVNLALPGSGPVVAEHVLERLLAARPDAQPELVVLAFSTLSYTEWRPNFVEYPLTHLLPFGPVGRAAIAERDGGYLLEWFGTRLPTVRHREELKSGARSLTFDRWPTLAGLYRTLTGDETDHAQFAWRHRERSTRNRRLAEDLIANRGWRLFEEMRLPTGELDANVRFDEGAFYFPSFEATAREEQALTRLLDLCAARGIPVLVLPAAQPAALHAALALDDGDLRLRAFEQRLFANRPGVSVPNGLALSWPHRYFADLAHVNEAGVDRYTSAILPVLRDSAAGLGRRDTADGPG